ncbi:tautomerase family protein [Marinobacter sp. UBA3607]|uniref:tautomerase family protein n=1 Tax=Marinobacter sp. UBA3607 TaxID=1946820 RepID=UPI00257AF705|nr:tautomerase family protein [Marinobacter sp. UBA3607]
MAGVSHAHLHCHGRESVSVAAAITAAHNAQTGAPRFFAQVLFSAANEGDHFVGGRVNTAPQVYVQPGAGGRKLRTQTGLDEPYARSNWPNRRRGCSGSATFQPLSKRVGKAFSVLKSFTHQTGTISNHCYA